MRFVELMPERGTILLTFHGDRGTYEIIEAYIGEAFGDAMARASTPISGSVTRAFVGEWSFSPFSWALLVSPLQPITKDSPRALYPVWVSVHPYPIPSAASFSFMGNGGTPRQNWVWSFDAEIETFDEVFARTTPPMREGYRFTGWFDAPTGGEQIQGTDAVPQWGGVFLYAQWEREEA